MSKGERTAFRSVTTDSGSPAARVNRGGYGIGVAIRRAIALPFPRGVLEARSKSEPSYIIGSASACVQSKEADQKKLPRRVRVL